MKKFAWDHGRYGIDIVTAASAEAAADAWNEAHPNGVRFFGKRLKAAAHSFVEVK